MPASRRSFLKGLAAATVAAPVLVAKASQIIPNPIPPEHEVLEGEVLDNEITVSMEPYLEMYRQRWISKRDAFAFAGIDIDDDAISDLVDNEVRTNWLSHSLRGSTIHIPHIENLR